MKIQIKKEMGWLLFLLLPFLTLLVLHFIIPLLFTLKTVPLLQLAYNSQRISLQHHNVRSFTEINQQIINSALSKYYNIFKNLKKFIDLSVNNFFMVNLSQIQLNNAFIFSQSVENNSAGNYSQPKSMWFATNATTLNDLDVGQQEIYDSYVSVQTFIRSQFAHYHSSALEGISTAIVMESGQMYFEYPSYFNQVYKQLTSTDISPYYLPTLQNYLNHNQSITPFLKITPNIENRLMICSVLRFNGSQTDIYGVSCLTINLIKFNRQISQIISFVKSSYTYTSYYLLLTTFIQNQRKYLIMYKFSQNQTQTISLTPQQTDYFTQNFQLSAYDHTYIQRKGPNTFVFGPIVLIDQLDHQNTVLFFMTQNQFVSSTINQGSFSSSINVFIGSIVALIAVSALATFCVLRRIMNGLDSELLQLEKQSRFIVDGDMNVQIPEYTGTKDIRQVYDSVRTINKLHRLSTAAYFSGHHVNKILKYTQALHFLTTLGYQTGAVLQNLAESYLLMEEYEKAIEYFKQCCRITLTKIREQYGTIDYILQIKKQKRVPTQYKQLQIVLIRRLFNLVFCYFCFLSNFSKKQNTHCSLEQQKKMKQMAIRDAFDYILLLKKAFYPQFTTYAECNYVMFFETLLHIGNGQFDIAKSILDKISRISDIYIQNYHQVGKKLKEKGSKFKLFHSKNKISIYSRSHPEIVKTFRNYVRGKMVQVQAKKPHYNDFQAFTYYFEGIKAGMMTTKVSMLNAASILNKLKQLNINLNKIQSTQIYRQLFTFKAINDKKTEGNAQNHDQKNKQKILGLQREFVCVIDCVQNTSRQNQSSCQLERAVHVFDKIIQDRDRLSILKFNTTLGFKVQCNLTLKKSKEVFLRKQLYQSFSERGAVRSSLSGLYDAFERSVIRIRKLKSAKVVLFFFQKIQKYSQSHTSNKNREEARNRRNGNPIRNTEERQRDFNNFGEWIVKVIQESEVTNCTVCLFCGEGDRLQDFRLFFGLQNVNDRLWKMFDGLNKCNNTVFVMSSAHRSDVDRALLMKPQQTPDNHIFLL